MYQTFYSNWFGHVVRRGDDSNVYHSYQESFPGNQAKLVKRESSRPCPGQRCRQCITCLVSQQFGTIWSFFGEKMSLVTGIRVKCGSANKYKEFGKTERDREERLGR